MKQTIEIEVPDGYNAKWNHNTQKIELIKKDSLPTTWEEYTRFIKDKNSYYVDMFGATAESTFRPCFDEFQSKETAEAFAALGKLIQLRDEWWGQLNWKPDWNRSIIDKYTIFNERNIVHVGITTTYNRILSFPTEETRDKFLECFKDLIETAKPLL